MSVVVENLMGLVVFLRPCDERVSVVVWGNDEAPAVVGKVEREVAVVIAAVVAVSVHPCP